MEHEEKRFPWVDRQEFLAHYSQAMAMYLEVQNPHQENSKEHIEDLSLAASAFAEAWDAIFTSLEYTQ